MSELKSYKLFHRASALTSPEFLSVVEFGNGDEVYLKSEADKVIAELKNENERLKKQSSCTFSDDCLRLRQTKRELRRQKYKRCLDNAEYWVAVSYQCVDDKHRQSAERHHRKWLELAEKFKEAK